MILNISRTENKEPKKQPFKVLAVIERSRKELENKMSDGRISELQFEQGMQWVNNAIATKAYIAQNSEGLTKKYMKRLLRSSVERFLNATEEKKEMECLSICWPSLAMSGAAGNSLVAVDDGVFFSLFGPIESEKAAAYDVPSQTRGHKHNSNVLALQNKSFIERTLGRSFDTLESAKTALFEQDIEKRRKQKSKKIALSRAKDANSSVDFLCVYHSHDCQKELKYMTCIDEIIEELAAEHVEC